MGRCFDFYRKWAECGEDWCEKAASSVSEINAYLGIIEELEKDGIPREFAFANFKEGAARPIFRSRKEDSRSKGVAVIKKRLKTRIHLNDNLKTGQAPIETRITSSESKEIMNEIERAPQREEMVRRGREAQKADDSVTLYHGDFLKDYLRIPAGSVDCIITDPPYVKEWLHNFTAFSEAAEYVLKPGGFLIMYMGPIHLNKVMAMMEPRLNYFWIMAITHPAVRAVNHWHRAKCGHKPILIFNKLPALQPKRYFNDLIIGSAREKGLHEWQQGEEELRQIFEPFTDPGDIVLDPFMGSGTVLSMAKKMNRRAMGWDINKDNVDVVRGRLV